MRERRFLIDSDTVVKSKTSVEPQEEPKRVNKMWLAQKSKASHVSRRCESNGHEVKGARYTKELLVQVNEGWAWAAMFPIL